MNQLERQFREELGEAFDAVECGHKAFALRDIIRETGRKASVCVLPEFGTWLGWETREEA